MTVLIKQTSSLQSIGKCGSRVVCHGAQRHAVVCLDHTHLGERLFDGDGVDLTKEGIDERLAGNLYIAGARYVAVQMVPEAPRLMSGTVSASSPEYMRKSSDSRWAILAA